MFCPIEAVMVIIVPFGPDEGSMLIPILLRVHPVLVVVIRDDVVSVLVVVISVVVVELPGGTVEVEPVEVVLEDVVNTELVLPAVVVTAWLVVVVWQAAQGGQVGHLQLIEKNKIKAKYIP